MVKRYTGGNIIICERVAISSKINAISNEISIDVHFEQNVSWPIANEIYGVYMNGKWYRGIVKFETSKTIMHLLDRSGVLDVRQGMIIRKIQKEEIRRIPFGQIKLFIYGIAKFETNELFDHIFKQTLENVEVTSCFSLIEDKLNLVHQTFAGDLLYEANGKIHSFREILIREQLTIPKQVRSSLNQALFASRMSILTPSIYTTFSTQTITATPAIASNSGFENVQMIRFEIYIDVLGEGTVIF